MRITIARLGPPADHNGNIVAPGAIPACSVPLVEAFDCHLPTIGRVELNADGSGDIALLEGIELETEKLVADETIGLAFRVLEDHWEDSGVRVIDRLEVFGVGVSRDLIKRVREQDFPGPMRWACRRCGNPRRRAACLSCGNTEPITDERRVPGLVS